MFMQNFIRKITSRKLWLAIAGAATGIAIALGADASEIQTVAGSVVTLASTVTYIITEGKVDAARVEKAAQAAQNAAETITEE